MSRLVACFALCVSIPAAAAPRTLSLYEAEQLALHGNPTLGRAELAVDDAGFAIAAFDATFDTQVAIDATGRGERAQPRSSPFTQPLARDSGAIAATLSRAFRDGGEARFGVTLARELATIRLPLQLGHEDIPQTTVTPRVDASYRLPLWGGRRIATANQAQLSGTRRAIGFDAQATRMATVRDVTRAYWQLYLASREVAIRGDARRATEEQLRQVEAEIARGARPRLAAIELEDALARLREDELVAIGAVAERSLDLSRVMGIAPTAELVPRDKPEDLVGRAGGTLSLAPRLIAAEARIGAARGELDRVHDETRWRIDAVLNGSMAAPRDTLHVALDDTASYGGWTFEIGLIVRGPLSGRARDAKRGGARARLQAAQMAYREVEAELAGEAVRLSNRREVARERRSALVRAVDLAEQNLRAERNRWERGDATAFELLRRQAALGETRLRLERARVDELEADVALAALYGGQP